jgi:HEAT repeat protein
VTPLQIILFLAILMAVVSLAAILAWLVYGAYLTARERRLAARKGLYRDLVTGLATRERELLEPAIRQLETIRDVEALEAVLEEQARKSTDRPAWLLDTYDRLGLVQKYVGRLRGAGRWRDRAFAGELLGRVGNATAVPALLETVRATRTEDADVREIALRALARIADPRAVKPLVVALRESEPWLAPRIADILVRHGEAVVDPMLQFLEEPGRHPARAWAANVLGELRVPRAFAVLTRALEDVDDEVRAKAATALGQVRDTRAVPYLLDRLLTDPAPFVRARIAGALGRFDAPEVVDRLVRGLGDPAWWVRMRSVEALEQIGAPAEGALLAALEDTDPEIRLRAAVGLERLGVPARLTGMIERGEATPDVVGIFARFGHAGARELLAEQLRHPSAPVRVATVEAIRLAARRDVAAELISVAAADESAEVRAGALDTLRLLGVSRAVPTALDRLADTDDAVRAAAVALVGHLGGAEAAGPLRERSGDPTPAVRAGVARALGMVGAPDARDDFSRLLHDPEPSVRAAAAAGAGEAGCRPVVPDLVERLTDSEPAVREAAARALGRVGDPTAVPILLRTLRTADAGLREAVAEAVPRLDPSAAPALLEELRGLDDAGGRVTAVRALAQARQADAVPVLAQLWNDPAGAVRAEVAAALGRMGATEAAPLLEHGLGDPDPAVRARSVDGLARLGGGAVAPALVRMLSQDPDGTVRERAALALGLLRAEGGESALLQACLREPEPAPRAAAVLALGSYDQESLVARLLEMGDEAEVRRVLESRQKDDAEYRLLAHRVRASRHAELRALAAPSRPEMEQSLAEGIRGALDPAARVRLVDGLRAFQGERSRGALRQVLQSDPAPQVRAAALTALGGMADPAELEELAARALTDPDLAVRHTAVTLFQRLPAERALPRLLTVLRADDDPVVLEAVGAQAESAFDAFVDHALGAGTRGEELVAVAHVARYIHHPGLARLLPPMAGHARPDVREAVAELFLARPELARGDLLEGLLGDPVPEVRRHAVRAAMAAKRPAAAAALARDPDPAVRTEVARTSRPGPDAPLPALLGDPEPGVRAAAVVAALLGGAELAVPADLDRAALAAEIAAATDRGALRVLVKTHPDPARRAGAGVLLALAGDTAAADVAAQDPSDQVRARVRAALGEA